MILTQKRCKHHRVNDTLIIQMSVVKSYDTSWPLQELNFNVQTLTVALVVLYFNCIRMHTIVNGFELNA